MASILVVDDQAEVRVLIAKILTASGHQVQEAGDGKKAVRMLKELAADLVILDLFMPEQEGLETIMQMRRERIMTPVLAISGGCPGLHQDFLEAAHALGARRTLAKPFTRQELLTAVREVLAAAQAAVHSGQGVSATDSTGSPA